MPLDHYVRRTKTRTAQRCRPVYYRPAMHACADRCLLHIADRATGLLLNVRRSRAHVVGGGLRVLPGLPHDFIVVLALYWPVGQLLSSRSAAGSSGGYDG
jgi:hypothetical protein